MKIASVFCILAVPALLATQGFDAIARINSATLSQHPKSETREDSTYNQAISENLIKENSRKSTEKWENGSYPNLDAIFRRDSILMLRDSLEKAHPNDARNKALGAVQVPKKWLENYENLCKGLNKNSRVLYRTWDGRYALVASIYSQSEESLENRCKATIDSDCNVTRGGEFDETDAWLFPYPIHISNNLWKDMKMNWKAATYKPFYETFPCESISLAAFYSVDLSQKNLSKLLHCTQVSAFQVQKLRVDKSKSMPLATVPDEDAGDGYTCAIDSLGFSSPGVYDDFQTLLLRLDGATTSKEFHYDGHLGSHNLLVHKDRSHYTIIKDDILLADSNHYAQPITYDITGKKLGEGSLVYQNPALVYTLINGISPTDGNQFDYFVKIPAQLKNANKLELETAILAQGKPLYEYSDLFSVKDSTATTPPDRELYHAVGYQSDSAERQKQSEDGLESFSEEKSVDLSGSRSILVRVNIIGVYNRAFLTEEGDLITFRFADHMPLDHESIFYNYSDEEWSLDESDLKENCLGQLLLRVDPNYVTELRKIKSDEDFSSSSDLDKKDYLPARSYFFTSADVVRPAIKQLRKQPNPNGSHYTIEGAVIVYKANQKKPSDN